MPYPSVLRRPQLPRVDLGYAIYKPTNFNASLYAEWLVYITGLIVDYSKQEHTIISPISATPLRRWEI